MAPVPPRGQGTDDTVYVRIVLWYELERRREYINLPTHIYLEQALGDRKVYDVEAEREVPLFVPDR